MARKDSDASSVESFDYSLKQGIFLDFSMFYYVFDKLLLKYFKIKKGATEAQKTIKSLDDSDEQTAEQGDTQDTFEFEQPKDIID